MVWLIPDLNFQRRHSAKNDSQMTLIDWWYKYKHYGYKHYQALQNICTVMVLWNIIYVCNHKIFHSGDSILIILPIEIKWLNNSSDWDQMIKAVIDWSFMGDIWERELCWEILVSVFIFIIFFFLFFFCHWKAARLKDLMLITFSSPGAQPVTGSSTFFDIKWKPIFF